MARDEETERIEGGGSVIGSPELRMIGRMSSAQRMFATGLLVSVASLPTARAQERLQRWYGDAPSSLFGVEFDSGFDLSGDGVADFLVSAPYEGGTTFNGAIFVISGVDGSVVRRILGGAGEVLQSSMFVDDIDGDGWEDFLVESWNPPGGRLNGDGVVCYSGKTGSSIYSVLGAKDEHLSLRPGEVGDFDGDGISDFLVSRVIPYYGREVDVHSGVNGKRIRAFKVPRMSNYFGESVATGSDVDGDGVSDFVIGDYEWPYSNGQGAIWIYSGKTATLLYEIDGPTYLTYFGRSVVFMHDIDQDGVADIAVGAPGERLTYSENEGHVHIYSGKNGAPLLDVASPTQHHQNIFFGASLADPGDLNHDGFGDLLVFQPWGGELDGSFGASVVRVMSGRDGRFMGHYFEPAENVYLYGDGFGAMLQVIADRDGDGLPELLAGLPHESVPDGTPDHEGALGIWRLDDLYVEATPSYVDPADQQLSLTVGQGAPAAPYILWLVNINGMAVRALIEAGALDASGRAGFALAIPPGLSGLTLGFKAFSIDTTGKIIDSGVQTVWFR